MLTKKKGDTHDYTTSRPVSSIGRCCHSTTLFRSGKWYNWYWEEKRRRGGSYWCEWHERRRRWRFGKFCWYEFGGKDLTRNGMKDSMKTMKPCHLKKKLPKCYWIILSSSEDVNIICQLLVMKLWEWKNLLKSEKNCRNKFPRSTIRESASFYHILSQQPSNYQMYSLSILKEKLIAGHE